ncbi:MAG: T9SS type A sorting domain-containing protein [bacterium]|nr:T9SS type A sorting domain-containing protein [bacterium]
MPSRFYSCFGAACRLLVALTMLCSCPCVAEILLNEIVSCNINGITDLDDDTSDWLELINTGPELFDVYGFCLSDDEDNPGLWTLPSHVLQAGEHLLIFASGKDRVGLELHSNFRISSAGETVILTNRQGQIVDMIEVGSLPVDVSTGRSPDGTGEWCLFDAPTPGEANRGRSYSGIAGEPVISVAGGLYSAPFQVTITDPTGEADYMVWTTEGWDPQPGGTHVEGPIEITASTVLRARCFRTGKLPGRIVTCTYLLDESSDLPVVSLVTDPDNLWDQDTGIYVLGDDYEPDRPYFGANFWEEWEKPAHLEFFDTADAPGFAVNLGIKIHGGWSRSYEQKSFRCISRAGYETDTIAYPLFPNRDVQEFKTLILRNAGTDWSKTHLRDGLQHEIASATGIDTQGYRPATLFLNGVYWGIMNIRERLDKHYLERHHGVDPDMVDILEDNARVKLGSATHYLALVDFIEDNSLSLQANYDYVRTQMDIDNFTTYEILEIYLGNIDWPGNNIQFWRAHDPGSLWRWQFCDLDCGLGRHTAYDFDMLAYALGEEYRLGCNPPWSVFLLQRLLENDDFRIGFVNRYCDMMNSILLPGTMEPLAGLCEGAIASGIDRHMLRWDFDPSIWYGHMAVLHEYIAQRPDHAREHLRSQFDYTGEYELNLDIAPSGCGRIALTALTVSNEWSGIYLQGNPVRLEAVPAPGYIFQSWSDPELPVSPTIWIDPEESPYSLTATFIPAGPAGGAVIINEINYNSADDFDSGDWVELHNTSVEPIDISDWIFKDSDDAHIFTFPQNTVIAARRYLVLCVDEARFATCFPTVTDRIGDTGFGFSGSGEALRLFSADGIIQDLVVYDDADPWPSTPDGQGPTLELIHHQLDNSDAASWGASAAAAPHGTPGEINSIRSAVAVPEGGPSALTFGAAWPNPFNPATRLSFTNPVAGRVTLTIHDVNGRMIAVLVDELLAAGHHEIPWQPRGLSSGLYLARLSWGGRVLTQKLVLTK